MYQHIFHCAEGASGVLEYGVGFNWLDGFGPGEPDNSPTYPELENYAGWKALMEALDDLRPGFLRFGFPADALAGEQNGTIQTHSVHLERLEKVAKWAENNDCSILLDSFSIPKRYQFPESTDKKTTGAVRNKPRDNRAYAREFVVPLLKHVVESRGLKAVKMFNPINEPKHQTPDNKPDAYVHYVNMFKEMQSALASHNLWPDKIKLAGVDCIHPSRFPGLEMLARGIDIDPYLDCYTIHYYFHRFDWMNPVPFLWDTIGESIDRQTARLVHYCSQRRKPLVATELGWYPQDGEPPNRDMPKDVEGSARHFAALITAETMIRGMNAGLAGFAIWSLLNPNNRDGHWRVIALQKGTLWKAPNLYPAYRLFSSYARPGSSIHAFRANLPERPWQYVHATALQTPDGKLVVYAVNDNLVETKSVRFVLPANWGKRKFAKYIKDEVRPGTQSGETECLLKDGLNCIEDCLMPMSLTAYVEV